MAAVDTELHAAVRGAPGLAPSTRNRYLRDLNHWIAFAGADPTGWTRAQAMAYLIGRAGTPATIKRTQASLAFAARWWARAGGHDFMGRAPARVLTEHEVRKLLVACGSDPGGLRDAALLVLVLETGLRWNIVAGLEIPELDWKPLPVARIPTKHGELVVPLSPTCGRVLGAWLAWLNTRRGPVFPGLVRTTSRSEGYLVQRTALSGSGAKKALDARARLAAVLPGLDLRATFLAWRLNMGYSPEELAIYEDAEPNQQATAADLARLRAGTPPWLAELIAARCP